MFVICKKALEIDWERSQANWVTPHGVINGFIPKNRFFGNSGLRSQTIPNQTVGSCFLE